jgi:hypothetical protein
MKSKHECPTCGRHLPLQLWCKQLRTQPYSLWTAGELASIYGCSAHRMGVALSKLFRKRPVALGPDGRVGRKQKLYCVWPAPFDVFFRTLDPGPLRILWREQSAQRTQSAAR